MNGSGKMHVKNRYPLNTADEDLMKLVGTVSYYLSNITAVHTAIDISTTLPEEYINDIIADLQKRCDTLAYDL